MLWIRQLDPFKLFCEYFYHLGNSCIFSFHLILFFMNTGILFSLALAKIFLTHSSSSLIFLLPVSFPMIIQPIPPRLTLEKSIFPRRGSKDRNLTLQSIIFIAPRFLANSL